MTRKEVRDFISEGIYQLNKSYGFNSGRITEFNSARDNEYPFLWMESLSSENTINQASLAQFRNWNVVIHIAKKDAQDSKAEEYEGLIDDCDALAYQLTKQLNHDIENSNLIQIESTTIEPFIKRHADNTTGVILSFTLIDFDSTDVC